MNRRQAIARGLGGFAYLGLTGGCAQADDPWIVARRFDGSLFTVCRYDPDRADLRLVQADATGADLRSFDRLAGYLGRQASAVRFAMNAGMFDGAGAPIGLYVEDGVVRHGLNEDTGSGNFYMAPNGVFFVSAEGVPGVETTAVFARRQVMPRWATQSGPMLVIDGALHPDISPEGTSANIRNGVGMAGDGTAVFVISEDKVSFGRLARFLRDGLGCRDALYLDGFVSSLWLPSQGRRDRRAELGPMVVVMDKG